MTDDKVQGFVISRHSCLLSVTRIHLAAIPYVLKSKNINMCKLVAEVPRMIYLNKFVAERLDSSSFGHLLRKIL